MKRPSNPETLDHVGRQTRRGLTWNLASAVMINGTRLAVLVVLGRVLTSRDFGVVAAAVSVNTIVSSIRDVGIGPALIQRKQLEAGHLTAAFAVSLYLGVALSSLLFVAAPLIGEVFRISESINVIRALALLFLLRNVAATSRMVCRREMNFRLIAIADASSFMAGSIVSMVAAIAGAGPWALVAGYLVEELVAMVLLLVYVPPKVSLRIDWPRLRELLSYGVGQTITQTANIAALYGDNLVVGHTLGPHDLGFYSRAYDLIKFPAMLYEAVVANVLFPAFSRMQDDRASIAAGLRRGTFINALLLFPAGAVLFVIAPEAIRILIGPGWDDAVLPFQIFAITMVLRTNQKLSTLVAQAAGAVNAVALAYVIYMLSVVGGAVVSIQWGVAGVAASTTIAILIINLESCYLAMRVSGLSLPNMSAAHVPGIVLAGLVAVVAWPLAGALRTANLPVPVTLTIVVVTALAVCLVVISLWIRGGRRDFAWLGEELRKLRRRRPRSS